MQDHMRAAKTPKAPTTLELDVEHGATSDGFLKFCAIHPNAV